MGVSWVLAPSSMLGVTFDEPPGDNQRILRAFDPPEGGGELKRG